MVTTLNLFSGIYAFILSYYLVFFGQWNTFGHALAYGGTVLAMGWLATITLFPGVIR